MAKPIKRRTTTPMPEEFGPPGPPRLSIMPPFGRRLEQEKKIKPIFFDVPVDGIITFDLEIPENATSVNLEVSLCDGLFYLICPFSDFCFDLFLESFCAVTGMFVFN